MKRLALVFLAVVLGVVSAGAAEADIGRSVGAVTADVWVTQVGPACPGCPDEVIGPAHLQVHALDVDPSPVVCLGCQTADIGWLRYDGRGSTGWLRISSVELFESSAGSGAIVSAGGFLVVLIDGGVPGNAVTGPPGPGGIAPTRDYFYGCCTFTRPVITGWVQAGDISISKAELRLPRIGSREFGCGC